MTFSQFDPPWLSLVLLSVKSSDSLGSNPSSGTYQLDRSEPQFLYLSGRVMATYIMQLWRIICKVVQLGRYKLKSKMQTP